MMQIHGAEEVCVCHLKSVLLGDFKPSDRYIYILYLWLNMPVLGDHHVVSMLPKLRWFIGSNGPANLVIDFSVHHSDIWPMPKSLCPKIRCSCIPNVDRLFVLIFLMKMTILCASPIFGHTVANPSISYIPYSIPCSIFIMFLLQCNISRHNSYYTPQHIHSYPVYPYMSCTPKRQNTRMFAEKR